MEEGADWGTNREEANNRREEGRWREKQRKMTGRLGTYQLIILQWQRGMVVGIACSEGVT